MNNPLVSVIIPVYNVEQYLRECLQSIISQTYTNLQIIIVNDGSTDQSQLIIDEFLQIDHRIKVINQTNLGLSDARNAGLEIAEGEFTIFVDSDDWILDTMIENMMKFSNNFELVLCSYNRFYENVIVPRIFDLNDNISSKIYRRRLIGLFEKELNDPTQTDSIVTACCKLYRTEIIKNNQIKFVSTKEIGTEDLLFNLEYSILIKNVFVLNKPLYMYRRNNANSLTSTYKPNLFNQWQNLYKKIYHLIENERYDTLVAFKNRIALSLIGLGLNEMQNNKGFRSRYNNLKNILNFKRYIEAYQQLEYKYFPIHWKIFFLFAKYRFVFGVYLMFVVIKIAVNRNK